MEQLIKLFEELKESKNEEDLLISCYTIKEVITNNKSDNFRLLLNEKIIEYLKFALSGGSGGSDNTHPEVIITTIKMITLTVKSIKKESIQIFNDNGIFELIFKKINNESIGVAQSVMNLFEIIFSKYIGQDNECILLPNHNGNNWFQSLFNQLLQEYSLPTSSKIIFFRILDIGSLLLNLDGGYGDDITKNLNSIQSSSSSNSNEEQVPKTEYQIKVFEKFKEPFMNVLARVFNESNINNDMMTQMSILEIVEKTCNYSTSLESIFKIGLIKSLIEMLNSTKIETTNQQQQDPSSIDSSNSPILNKSISLISLISQSSNENTLLLVNYENTGDQLIEIFKYHLNNSDSNPLSRKLKQTILASIGIIGRNNKGLDLLLKHPSLIKIYTEFFLSNDQETIITCYNSFSIMLKSSEKTYTVSDKLFQIFQTLPNGLLGSKITKNYNSPIEEIKMAAFSLIQSLCIHSWGASEMIRMPGFFEYLVNRNNENTKLAREWKFYIIQTIVHQHKDLFTSDAEWRDRFHQFESFIKKGVHFVPYESVVLVKDEFQN